MKNKLSKKEFNLLAKDGRKVVPFFKRIMADTITPTAAWANLSMHSDYGFILESVEKAKKNGRYSYVGINPSRIFEYDQRSLFEVINGKRKKIDANFFDFLKNLNDSHKSQKLDQLPHFTGGIVGYFGYEMIDFFENVPVKKTKYLQIPDSKFMLFEDIIVFDHLNGDAIVVSNVNLERSKNLNELFDEANSRVDSIGNLLHSNHEFRTPLVTKSFPTISNFKKSEFEKIVNKAKKYVKSGDIFQVVLSQRFERKTLSEPLNVYRALRSINPSPYMFHLKIDSFDVIGASPELMIKVQEGEVEIRPIAGTRLRGKNATEDERNAQDLLNDKKELAEHLMLLDLGRNDVGRVSEFDSVKIKEKMNVEMYSHVMHIVSDVRGKLMKDKNIFDALKSGFPAGTVSGAPKIRAMEIINELENDSRGIFSGAIGFIDFNGNLNTCISIRTMILKNEIAYFQAGAGIVYDSIPSKEYDETVNKAKVMNAAIDLAENGLIK